jgi:glucans biosynthesis protein
MYWSDGIPVGWSGARTLSTRVGRGRKDGSVLFVVDFGGEAVSGKAQLPVATVNANPGTVENVTVHPNPEIDGVRVSFELDPGGTDLSELRLVLRAGEQQISESWLYRWTKS